MGGNILDYFSVARQPVETPRNNCAYPDNHNTYLLGFCSNSGPAIMLKNVHFVLHRTSNNQSNKLLKFTSLVLGEIYN